ncbi:protein FAM166B isoform X3 [Neophocaena asiaeorientalis asiaeorientalis]|uniref:Ciliary microtubule inner protein 2B n=1 Tax=Neophocaena asiaeorientalis asiaeorientalis TaxID=1706337 RepID=A0A341CVQ4_NEOAA|nr:protein FAM166B isoform X3 [Neophocaena asiaeorientalis asiaeorientalis]
MASTFIPGLNPQNPHYIPGYTGHCPLLRFSMGQTYGQMTGQLLRGSPGLARPPSHRTLLPPIRPPRSPEGPRKSLPVRRGHERLSSSMIPGYTGFVPQAQFIFAKNSSQVWAEALNDFTQWYGRQRSQELPKEAKGEKDVEKDQEPKLEAELETEKEPELGQEAEQVRPRRLMGSTRREWGALPLLPLIPWMTEILASSSCQALQEFGQMKSGGRSQKDPKHLPSLSRTYPQNLGLVPKYGGYVPGYKFQFGRTYGHLTHDALGLSTIQKQLLA